LPASLINTAMDEIWHEHEEKGMIMTQRSIEASNKRRKIQKKDEKT
jgi:hypothetical protein